MKVFNVEISIGTVSRRLSISKAIAIKSRMNFSVIDVALNKLVKECLDTFESENMVHVDAKEEFRGFIMNDGVGTILKNLKARHSLDRPVSHYCTTTLKNDLLDPPPSREFYSSTEKRNVTFQGSIKLLDVIDMRNYEAPSSLATQDNQ